MRAEYPPDMDAAPAAPEDWTRALDRSRADLTAGRVVDGAGARARLRGSIERMAAVPTSETQPEPEELGGPGVRR